MTTVITILQENGTPVVSSEVLAEHMDNQHKNTLEVIRKYQEALGRFGQVAFKTRPGYQSSEVTYALLNEEQALYVLALSRNSDRVVALKGDLVEAFSNERKGRVLNATPVPLIEDRVPKVHAAIELLMSSPWLDARDKQLTKDSLMNVIVGSEALPNPERLVGVTEVAEELGYKTKDVTRNRSQLGKHVKRQLGEAAIQKDHRLVNGRMTPVNCYPRNLPGLEEAIHSFFAG